ncbi:hypothetical protein [Enterococcus sp. AZ128]
MKVSKAELHQLIQSKIHKAGLSEEQAGMVNDCCPSLFHFINK